MSDEDRFSDLGGQSDPTDDGRTAAERLEDEDRLRPEADDPRRKPPEVRGPGNKYAWVVGFVMLMGIGVLLLTTAIPNRGVGFRGPPKNQVLPDFAAPLVTGNVEGDANVYQKRNPGSDDPTACEVRGDQVVNICDLRSKPVVLSFLFDRGAECNFQIDQVERLKPDFPGVNFVAVYFSNEDRGEVADIVRRREWTMPVALDTDGAVVNLYNIGGCPTVVFARAGGKVRSVRLGKLSEDQLRREVQAVARSG